MQATQPCRPRAFRSTEEETESNNGTAVNSQTGTGTRCCIFPNSETKTRSGGCRSVDAVDTDISNNEGADSSEDKEAASLGSLPVP